MTDARRYHQIVELLQKYTYEYHSLDRPSVSDAVYDGLVAEAQAYEQARPDKADPNSPTQRVGSQPLDDFQKVEHKEPMLSINHVFTWEEVIAWDQRNQDRLPKMKACGYFVDFKMDGLALSVHYRRGQLWRAVTRGDGRTGEEVTANARTIKNLPLELPDTPLGQKDLEIRGEIVIYKKGFAHFNHQQSASGNLTYANPRNLAAGTMRQLDSRIASQRPLVFLAYDLLGSDAPDQKTVFSHFKELGVSHNRMAHFCPDLSKLKRSLKRWSTDHQRQKLRFWADGIVIRINDRDACRALGSVGKSPRGLLAYKYPPTEAITVIEQIMLSIGRTGVATPIAVFEPVQLAGTTIRHASLHNADEIDRLDVRVGDTVVIYKAGEIIPKVDRVMIELRPKTSHKFDFVAELKRQHPDKGFERPEGVVAYRLAGEQWQTPQQLVAAVSHYGSRPALAIDGLGEETAQRLVDSGLVSSLADIYRLNPQEVAELDGLGEKSASQLAAATNNARQPVLSRFLFGLGIDHVGTITAGLLANHYQSLAGFVTTDIDELVTIDGIGPKVAGSITDWLNRLSNQQLLAELATLEVQPLTVEPTTKRGPLAGLKIVVSGRLEQWGRTEVGETIRRAGGQTQSGISPKTDYLVIGDKPSPSKVTRAKSMKIKVIDEQGLFRLLDG